MRWNIIAALGIAAMSVGASYSQEAPPVAPDGETPLPTVHRFSDDCGWAMGMVHDVVGGKIGVQLETHSQRWGDVYRADFHLQTLPPKLGRIICWDRGATITYRRDMVPLVPGQ